MNDQPVTQSTSDVLKYNLEIKNPDRFFKLLALVVVAVVMVRNAWLGDDGFITMRVVDNFLNGYGLVWNVGERVQVFTSPLWMFMLTLIYAVTREPYVTMYLLSLAVSLLGFWLVLYFYSKNYWTTMMVTLVMLFSASYIDYSSSGLENPLIHLFLILMLVVVFKRSDAPSKKLFLVSLLACLTALTRLDTVLFFIPLLIYLLYEGRHQPLPSMGILIAAFLPLLVWFGFATFYFGFPLPNTYYAKLPTNYAATFFFEHGIAYYLNSLHWDPITLLTIGSAIALGIASRDPRKIAIVGGVVLYLLYGLRIGGDFMSGRFLSAAFVVALIVLLEIDYAMLFGETNRSLFWFVMVVIAAIGISANYPPVFTQMGDSETRMDGDVANEKLFYFPSMGMLNHLLGAPIYEYGMQGLAASADGKTPVFRAGIGVFSYYAGPDIYVIDKHTLTDPLRARLPAQGDFRVGHYERPMPDGYEETIADNFTNHLQDPNLVSYYDKLSPLIHGDLFAPGRIQDIIAFNSGKYDGWLKTYAAKFNQ